MNRFCCLASLLLLAGFCAGCPQEESIPVVNGIDQPTSTATFDADVLQSQLPVLVDFSAEWCGPCRRMKPVVAQASLDYQGKMLVKTVDIDENPDLAMRYRVESIPKVILFRNGEAQDQIDGACSLQDLHRFVDGQLAIAAQGEPAQAPAGGESAEPPTGG